MFFGKQSLRTEGVTDSLFSLRPMILCLIPVRFVSFSNLTVRVRSKNSVSKILDLSSFHYFFSLFHSCFPILFLGSIFVRRFELQFIDRTLLLAGNRNRVFQYRCVIFIQCFFSLLLSESCSLVRHWGIEIGIDCFSLPFGPSFLHVSPCRP